MRTLFCLLLSCAFLRADPPDQTARWHAAKFNPKWSLTADKAIAFYQRNQARYENVAKMRPGTVPAVVIFGLHMRESDNNFRCSAAQGDPLTHRSVNVPRGRIPNVPPPYTWETSAIDGYFTLDHLDQKDWSNLQGALDAAEYFNGGGYMRPGRPPSPYLWSGTTLYGPPRGKYVADGRFDPNAVDQQLGVAAVLKRMLDRGIPLPAVFTR